MFGCAAHVAARDFDKGSVRSTALQESTAVRQLVFSPDSSLLASSSSGSVKVWSLKDGRLVAKLEASQNLPKFEFSPDGKTAAVLRQYEPEPGEAGLVRQGAMGALDLIELGSGKLIKRLAPRDVTTMLFSADGKLLFAGNADSSVTVFNAATGEKKRALVLDKNRAGPVRDLARSPDCNLVMTSHGFGAVSVIRAWNVATETLVLATPELQGGCLAATFLPDGKTLQTLFDLRDGNRQITEVQKQGGLRSWEFGPGESVKPASIEPRRHDGVARTEPWTRFSADGKQYVITGSARVYIQDLDARPEYETWLIDTGGTGAKLLTRGRRVTATAFSSDGKLVAAGDADGQIQLWRSDGSAYKPAWRAEPLGALSAVALSAGQNKLAVGTQGGMLQILDHATGAAVRQIQAHDAAIVAVTWSADGSAIASLAADGTVRIWDAAKGERAMDMKLPTYTPFVRGGLAFSRDGTRLAIASGDEFKVWGIAENSKSSVGDAGADFRRELRFYNAPDRVGRSDGFGRIGWRGLGTILGAEVSRDELVPSYAFTCAAADPKGTCVAAIARDTLTIYDAGSFKKLRQLLPKAGVEQRSVRWFRHVQFTMDGTKLLAVQDPTAWEGYRGQPDDPEMVGQGGQRILLIDV